MGTLLMAFGWVCAMAQGDGPQDSPKSAGLIVIFTLAFAMLAISAIRLRRAKTRTKYILLAVIGLQAACCVYAVVAESAL
jgi:hypothetical protein